MILNFFKFAALYIIAAVVVGAIALVLAYPYHPITALGWLVWFMLALPIYVILESLYGKVFSARVGYKIDESRESVSVSRIVFGFAFAVTMLILSMVIVLVASEVGGIFWEAHFSTEW